MCPVPLCLTVKGRTKTHKVKSSIFPIYDLYFAFPEATWYTTFFCCAIICQVTNLLQSQAQAILTAYGLNKKAVLTATTRHEWTLVTSLFARLPVDAAARKLFTFFFFRNIVQESAPCSKRVLHEPCNRDTCYVIPFSRLRSITAPHNLKYCRLTFGRARYFFVAGNIDDEMLFRFKTVFFLFVI